jgi:Protein of unknown function (DUF1549)/Protein of unknown function (DUF1553)
MRVFSPSHLPWTFLLAGLLFLTSPPSASAAVRLPNGSIVKTVDFERHVVALFGRMGCNAGSCHGSFQGKGGFRLSLFGYKPEMDYLALTRGSRGRRLNLTDPDSSLLLLKASGQMPHGGTRLFAEGDWQYQLLRQWISAGAPWQEGSGKVAAVTVTPPEQVFGKTGARARLTVTARFADGTKEDVTPLCQFRVNNDAVADVSNLGEVQARQAGDTSVVVSYRGHVIPVRVLVPMTPPPGFKYPKVAEVNYIDKHVFAKLRRLNIAPSELSSDAAFLRRVTLDTIGSLPTPEEIRKFLADRDPKKREKKINELLAHPLHAALWATKFCDITGNNTDTLENAQQLRTRLSQWWHAWFRKRLQANMPYDRIVHDVLCATSREKMSPKEYVKYLERIESEAAKGFDSCYKDKKTLDLFWRKQQRVPPEQWGEKTAVAFLGVRIECAQCHKHPFDRWTQQDYWAYANVFAPLTFGTSPEAKKLFDAETRSRRKADKKKRQWMFQSIREVYVNTSGRGVRFLRDPETNQPLAAKALGGPELEVKDSDPREALFAWMRSPENPFFARSFVNRVWGHYFGIGIVHPVDDFSLGNPSSNPALLDALAKDFIDSGYDIRKLEKKVLLSRTYQLSSVANETNRLDTNNYSRSYVRPLMAEVVVDIMDDALGTRENFGKDVPENCRAIEIGSTRIASSALREAFRVFGRPTRAAGCDCERPSEPTVSYKLFLMADPTLQARITPSRNRLRELLANKNLTDEQVLEELFLATLSRPPTKREKEKALKHIQSRKDRQTGFGDTLWALVNTTEFIFNH